MQYIIPETSRVQRMANGDVLITLPNALLPYLCVAQQGTHVRRAFTKQTVDSGLAQAARCFVAKRLQ